MQYTVEATTEDGARVVITVDTEDDAPRRQVEDALASAYIEAYRRVDKKYGVLVQ